MIYLLDTDHVSLDQRAHPQVSARIRLVGHASIAVSMITVEEQLRGWLTVIRAAKTAQARTTAYERLRRTIEYFASLSLLNYTIEADIRAAELKHQGIRVGTQDMRIAAIALTIGATVVTRNIRDFSQIPELKIEDWAIA